MAFYMGFYHKICQPFILNWMCYENSEEHTWINSISHNTHNIETGEDRLKLFITHSHLHTCVKSTLFASEIEESYRPLTGFAVKCHYLQSLGTCSQYSTSCF